MEVFPNTIDHSYIHHFLQDQQFHMLEYKVYYLNKENSIGLDTTMMQWHPVTVIQAQKILALLDQPNKIHQLNKI
jgi:hypothetical protein